MSEAKKRKRLAVLTVRTMGNDIVGYEVREDVLVDGTPVFDVYQLMDGDSEYSEYVETFYSEDNAVKYARSCAEDNGLGDVEVKVHRKESHG